MALRRRPARPADGDFVFAVTEAAMRGYCEATWGEWDTAFQREQHEAHFDPAVHEVLEIDGTPAGIVSVVRNDGWLQLEKLYLLPEHAGRGAGSTVLRELLCQAAALGQPLQLRVLAVNDAAQRLYLRHGFVVTHRTPERRYMQARPRPDSPVITICRDPADPGWLALRRALWPEGDAAEHLAEMTAFCAEPGRYRQFIARALDSGEPQGLVEVSLRSDYVNGTDSSPVGFLEGLYVVPGRRRAGIARRLVEAAAGWAASRGARELASDAALDAAASHAMHRALGFEETERVVYFRRAL